MQAVLCAAIRGCDGIPKDDPSKTMLRALRYAILNPSCEPAQDDPYNFASFMGYEKSWENVEARTAEFLGDLDPYPFHFVQHVAHAAHIVAVYHPDDKLRLFWRSVYGRIIVDGFHAVAEDDHVMQHRLRDR